jgi:hypothetical protein
MHKVTLVENNVAQYLKELTDTTQFSQEQIMVNLKDCLKGKKCCIFSCGTNIHEHKDKFDQIKKDKSFITCCIKSSIEHLEFEADILTLYCFINGTYLNNDKIEYIFTLKTNEFEYNGISYDLSNFNIPNFTTPAYNVINFLNYIGIKEIYLFGFYLADYIINDLTNYNYYDDILCKQFHTYDASFSRIKELGVILEHCDSIQLADYCIYNNISLYNVSEYGCLSNKIKRINFESIFISEKTFILSKIVYKDFLDEFDEKVDIDFYYERNCNYNNDIVTFSEKKDQVFNHLITEGIYCLKNVNRYDTKKEICLNDFIKDIIELICYISYYSVNNITYNRFFCHYLLKFNKVFNVCFYNDLDKISSPQFYDDLILIHLNDINSINFDNIYIEFNITKYNKNKYFKLFIYLFYLLKSNHNNIPEDFNTKEYIELNEDLKDMTEITAMIHYEHYGYKENRKYNYKYHNIPDDFNVKEYIELNEDLKDMTELQAKNHYEHYGYKENRKYTSFN